MRTFTLLFAAVFMFGTVAGHSSHSTADPGKLPGDLLYGLDRLSEDISLMLASGSAEKLEKKLEIADERLMESAVLYENGKQNMSTETYSDYRQTLEEARLLAEQTGNQTLQEEVEHHIEERQDLRLELAEKLPVEVPLPDQDTTSGNDSTPGATGSFMATGKVVE